MKCVKGFPITLGGFTVSLQRFRGGGDIAVNFLGSNGAIDQFRARIIVGSGRP